MSILPKIILIEQQTPHHDQRESRDRDRQQGREEHPAQQVFCELHQSSSW
jgi:hypothetical protein